MKKTLIAIVLALGAAYSVQAKDIVDTAVAAGNLKTLATALTFAVATNKNSKGTKTWVCTDSQFLSIRTI